MKTVILFFKKDFWEESSYPFFYISKIFKIFFALTMLYYLSKYLEIENGSDSIFPYLFSGHIFYEFLIKYLKLPSSILISELYKGTLEYLFNGKLHPYSIPILSNIYRLFIDYFILLSYIFVGIFFLNIKVNLSLFNIFFLHLVFLGALILVFSWGLIGSAITLLTKKGDPITTGWLYFSILAGGIYFPSTILPSAINIFNFIFPIQTWMELFRELFYNNHFMYQKYLILIIYDIILVLFSTNLFNFILKIAKKRGNLHSY
ncbi:hypothetical protein JXR93_14640 [bacterium]|nr:hypothetical protein [bacterium]